MYDEVNGVLNRTSPVQEAEDSKSTLPFVSTLNESCISHSDSKSSQYENPSTSLSKDTLSSNVSDSKSEEHTATGNAGLEVIIETDVTSETSKNERNVVLKRDDNAENALPTNPNWSGVTSEHCLSVQSKRVIAGERSKNLYDCRRAYSYPATNYIISGFGIHDMNSVTPYTCAARIGTTRSRSVSATCSYIPEMAIKRHFTFPHHQGMNELTTFSPLMLDERLKNFAASFTKHSVLSFGDRSPSVVLAFENPYNVIDLDSQLLLRAGDASVNKVLFDDSPNALKCDESGTKLSDNDAVVSRHRKLADFEPPDNTTFLLEHNKTNV